MEELGIGRPSTYASILSVLRDRNYVRMDSQALHPGGPRPAGDRLPDQLLRALRRHRLHRLAGGAARRHLRRAGGLARGDGAFWDEFSRAVEQTRDLKIGDVIDALDQDLGRAFLPGPRGWHRPAPVPGLPHGPARAEARAARQLHRLLQLPDLPIHPPAGDRGRRGGGETLKEGMRELGHHPDTGEDVDVRRGPYGLYVQQGEPDPEDKKAKPRRTSLPTRHGGRHDHAGAGARAAVAAAHGRHASRGREPIEAGIGRFGPYREDGRRSSPRSTRTTTCCRSA